VYAQIVIGCQTQSEIVTCEGCIAFKVCRLRQEINDKLIQKQQDEKELLQFYTNNQPILNN
jgi:hypothetical protein